MEKNIIQNPNFVYKNTFNIIENDLFEINNAFDIYSLQKDINKIYLCGSSEFAREIIDIFEFKGNKFEKKLSLKNHKEFIVGCKYFLNKKLKKEYLVSIDNGQSSSNSIIFQIINENIYNEILNIVNIYESIRHPFSLIFDYNSENNQLFYIHQKTDVDSEVISENKEIVKNINFTQGQVLYYDVWENSKNNKNYIVQCNTNYIYIYDIFSQDKKFIKIDGKDIYGKNFSSYILYNKNGKDILYIINEKGNIIFYDLLDNKITSIIKMNDIGLRSSCQFNEKYLIFLSKDGFFFIFDYNSKKIITKVCSSILSNVKTIKMINHNVYGKNILMSGFMRGLLLYKSL